MSYAVLQAVIVSMLVAGALAFAVWRLAGPFGRQRLMRWGAKLLGALGSRRGARRIEAARLRIAAAQSGSPCANCGPAAEQPHPPATRR
jgi:hypothetical protein